MTSFAASLRVVGLLTSILCSAAQATPVNIKQVQVSENDRVDLLLDGKLDASQIRTEFFNDIVQLSLTDTSVYPAKISSVSGKDLSKIFVYQYAPKLVRVRLTVNGKAESFQDKVQVKPNGRMLTIRLDGKVASAEKAEKIEKSEKTEKSVKADKLTSAAAQAQKTAGASTESTEAEERALLEKVLKNPVARNAETNGDSQRDSKAETPAAVKPTITGGTTDVITSRKDKRASSRESLGGKQDIVSPWKTLMVLVGVLACFGVVMVGFKKFVSAKGTNSALSRWVKKSLGKKEQMIEVLAMHQLGPKKSIHMVRVAGRTLVLGVADDSINLISELGAASLSNGIGATARDFGVASASTAPTAENDFLAELGEQLAQESGRPAVGAVAAYSAGASSAGVAQYAPASAAPRISARDRIRSRLEGMKQL